MLATVFSGHEVGFFSLIFVLALLGLLEYFRMLEAQKIPCFKLTGMLAAAGFLIISFLFFRNPETRRGGDVEIAVITGCLILVFARQMFARMRDREPMEAMAYTLFGLLYIPWLFSFLFKIVYLPPPDANGVPTGQYYVLFSVMVAKFSDMGAYVFGSLFGKHPFAPHISPKKTWEGFAGALITSLIGAYWLLALMPKSLSLLTFRDATVLALLLGFVAVVGDLAESIVKRSTLAKDSSHLLPGIGGTLDLIDSVLFTTPVMFFYMRWFLIPA